MKINNASGDVAFKSIYVVKEDAKVQKAKVRVQKLYSGNAPITKTEELYELLSVNGTNPNVRLIRNGGLFNDNFPGVFTDSIDLNSPPLLLVNDKVNQPATRAKRLVRRVNKELAETAKLTIEDLRAKLTRQEIDEITKGVSREGQRSIFYDEQFIVREKVQQNIKKRAAEQYKKNICRIKCRRPYNFT